MKRVFGICAALCCAAVLLAGCGAKDTADAGTQALPSAQTQQGTAADTGGDIATLPALDEARHVHAFAETELRVAEPVTGYCGNTSVSVHLDGVDYTMWGDDAVALTDILINADYSTATDCGCEAECIVDTEFSEEAYEVSLEKAFARHEGGQVALTEAQVDAIRAIVQRLQVED